MEASVIIKTHQNTGDNKHSLINLRKKTKFLSFFPLWKSYFKFFIIIFWLSWFCWYLSVLLKYIFFCNFLLYSSWIFKFTPNFIFIALYYFPEEELPKLFKLQFSQNLDPSLCTKWMLTRMGSWEISDKLSKKCFHREYIYIKYIQLLHTNSNSSSHQRLNK